jgi:hypothetical protein
MKLSQLKQLIKEELNKTVKEGNAQWNDVVYNISVDVERAMSSIYARLSKQYTNEYQGKNLEFSTWKGDSRIKQGSGVVARVEIEEADPGRAPMDKPFRVNFITDKGRTFFNISHVEEI